MFGKLMKYELRSVMKDFLFVWIGILALSVINAFTVGYGDTDVDGFKAFLLVVLPLLVLFALYIAAFVIAILYVLRRFWQGLLGQEGYLMFTLPVTAGQLIAAKALTALILEVVSVLVAILGGLIILTVQVPPETWGFTLRDVCVKLLEVLKDEPLFILAVVELAVLMLLSACQANLHLYAGMSLGHLAKKNRVAWSAVAVVGLNLALSLVSALLGRIVGEVQINLDLGMLPYPQGVSAGLAAGLGLACFYSAVICAAWFFLSRYVLKNKLNLE